MPDEVLNSPIPISKRSKLNLELWIAKLRMSSLGFAPSAVGANQECASSFYLKYSTPGTGLGSSEEVEFVYHHPTPQAWPLARRVRGQAESKQLKPAADMLEVIFTDVEFEHFLDDGKEVGQRAHASQRWGGGGAQEAACRGQQQGVLDRVQGYTPLMKLGC
jgi:hypothetical protein